ncbi:unnamed protein product [Durusdinium trenchii]|uniref:RING-type domain-containing protein n=1 Tax=Durusdinium trenchii TaxID=1381693 RepID=A0ABP0IDI7_9DINO
MFRRQLAQETAESEAAYRAETERMARGFVAAKMEDFMQKCHEASCRELVLEMFKGPMAELGFPDGARPHPDSRSRYRVLFFLEGKWDGEDVAACSEPTVVPAPAGTRITCPICHEHRPAVALIPCGHVICRDCQRCQQIRQCPMCREATSSATRGLFMD